MTDHLRDSALFLCYRVANRYQLQRDSAGKKLTRSFWTAFLALFFLVQPQPGQTHPHVFIDSQSEMVLSATQELTEIRHHWTFDPAFSAFAIQGLDENGDGIYTREELKDLADTNVDALSEYEFFTFLDQGNTEVVLSEPTNYWLDYDGSQLTLNFTLPVAEPKPVADGYKLQIYDPTIFVAFFLNRDQPATLTGASDGCGIEHFKVGENKLDSTTEFSDDFLAAIDELDNFASQFAEEVRLTCD